VSLEDDLRAALDRSGGEAQPARKPAPDGLQWSWDGNQGLIETPALTERPTTWDVFVRDSGLDPEEVEVIEPVESTGWDATHRTKEGDNVTVRMHRYKIKVRRRSAYIRELPLLFAEARRVKRLPKPDSAQPERVTIVGYADPQTGKVARRGGTPELIARMGQSLERLDDYLGRVKPEAAMLFDVGDAIEGFENTGNQMSTNDLSIMDQVDVASTVLFQMVNLLAKRTLRVGVRGIGSNHCRWRKGKDQLGTPGDDWGIFMLKQLRRALAMDGASFGHVDVQWPETFEETLSLEVAGRIIGLAHGHQAPRPEGIPLWWAKQVHGGQPIAHADILITGHYHHLRVQPSGRNPWTDRSKWWLQCPTMDNGSDWYRQISGDDSDPGLVVFTLTRGQDGYPFENLELL
jgi:hypothetical protein